MLAALAWIDEYGDRDGDGFVEYERRTPRGLPNQSWKDSHDSQRFADGRLARAADRAVRGAGLRLRRQAAPGRARAGRLGRRPGSPADSSARRTRCAARFDAAYWVDGAAATTRSRSTAEKRQVDALCSNVGHLLWSGIVPEHRVETRSSSALLGEELWSGWGVRTMSTGDAGYDPLGYHTGTVWPHDCSLIARRDSPATAGGRRRGGVAARRSSTRPPGSTGHCRRSSRASGDDESPFPIAYPVAASPQAWGAGTGVLLLRVLLGLEPDASERTLTTVAPGVPEWLGDVRLAGVRAFGAAWDVTAEAGRVRVDPG